LVVTGHAGVEAGEEAVEVLGVPVLIGEDVGGIRVGDDVFAEVALLLQDVSDQAAQEGNVRAGTNGDMQVGEGGSAAEARVDVDNRRAALFRLDDETERHRVALGHIRSLDDDAVAVSQSPLRSSRAASPERGAQTGHRGAVSYPRLVLDL